MKNTHSILSSFSVLALLGLGLALFQVQINFEQKKIVRTDLAYGYYPMTWGYQGYFCCNDTTKACTGKFYAGSCGVGVRQSTSGNVAVCAENPCKFPGVDNQIKEKQKSKIPAEYNRTAPTWEFTFEDTSPTRSSRSSVSDALCGNKQIDTNEECDLGRAANGPGPCSAYCKTYYCTDGIVTRQTKEECEPKVADRKTQIINGKSVTTVTYAEDSCGKTCTVPVSTSKGVPVGGCMWKILPLCGSSSSSTPLLMTPVWGYQASSISSVQLPVPSCGNDLQGINEECDQGTLNSDFSPNTCRSNCTFPRCGDSVRDDLFGEACDQGAGNSDTTSNACRTNCQMPQCGDGVVDTFEECDGEAGCSSRCIILRIDSADTGGSLCGNSTIESYEDCDDGNVFGGDGCSSSCQSEVSQCGNARREFGEDCDDGNAINRDGCSVTCSRTSNYCGDQVRDTDEECDDGNEDEKDMCISSCMLARCGDGFAQGVEQCDDANLDDGDGCDSTCRIETRAGESTYPIDISAVLLILFGSMVVTIAGLVENRRAKMM